MLEKPTNTVEKTQAVKYFISLDWMATDSTRLNYFELYHFQVVQLCLWYLLLLFEYVSGFFSSLRAKTTQ